jgi:cytochrome c5
MALSPARSCILGVISLFSLGGCGEDGRNGQEVVDMPKFQDNALMAGRSVWMGTCRACHLLGVAGAPAVTDFSEWERRLSKGEEALYQSALNGIRGDDDKYRMPPRGGNDRLTEEQVRLAVEYKIAAIEAIRQP